jgi:hypothetical protein
MVVQMAMLVNKPNLAERKTSTEEFTDSPNATNRSTVLLKQHLLHYYTSVSSVIIKFLKVYSTRNTVHNPVKEIQAND